MRRTALAVAALLVAASPAVAAGAYVTRGVNDASGYHQQTFYDESGTGAGPFDPVVQLPLGTSLGGSGVGAVYGPTAPGSTPSGTGGQPLLLGYIDSAGKVQQVSPTFALPTADQNAAQTIVAPGAPASKVQSVQGVSGALPVGVSGQYKATPPTQTDGQYGPLQTDASGSIYVNLARTPGSTFLGSIWTGYYSNALDTLGVGATYPRLDVRGHQKSSEAGSSDPLVGLPPQPSSGPVTAFSPKSLSGLGTAGNPQNLYRAYAIAPTAPSGLQYLCALNATAPPAANAAIAPLDCDPFNSTAAGAKATLNFGSGPPSGYVTGLTIVVTTSMTSYAAGTPAQIFVGSR